MKFSDFGVVGRKLIKLFMSFYKPQVSFPLNFALSFSVSFRNIISVKLSSWKIMCLGQKDPIRVKLFRLLSALMKVHSILFAIFETTRPVFIQTLEPCSRYFVLWKITLLYCFSWNYISFGPKEPIKVQNFRFLSAHVKIHQLCNLISFFCWKYIKFQIE